MDITNLTYAELETLKGEVLQALSDRRCEGAAEWLASKQGQELSARARKISEKYEKLTDSFASKQVKLNIGLDLTVNNSCDGSDLFDGSEYCITDLFEVEIDGTILNSKDFNSDFISTLESSMSDVLSNACADAIGVNPKLEKAVADFIEELNDFNCELEEAKEGINICSRDLLNNEKVAAKKTAKKGKK